MPVYLNTYISPPAKLRRSCAELYHDGATESGVWQIDPTGTNATYVYCQMGVRSKDGVGRTGVTQVEHNLLPHTRVRGAHLSNLKKVISYRGMDRQQLAALVSESAQCKQRVQLTCRHAQIWWVEMWWVRYSTVRYCIRLTKSYISIKYNTQWNNTADI